MFREPRAKKRNKIKKSLPLPLFEDRSGKKIQFNGNFNGLSVIINDVAEMEKLYYNGFFGKANLSRGFPCFSKGTEILRKRQFQQRTSWKNQLNEAGTPAKILIVPDSDSEEDPDDYFKNLKAQYEIDPNIVKETLNLNLEEAAFLNRALGCLKIYSDEKLLSTKEVWELFCSTDQYFMQNYIVYHYFRAKNWVVKSGMKFGGDFLLYKDGPPFFHASYLIVIDVLDKDTLKRREDLCRRSMETTNIIGLNRLCETAGKELLICQIIWPKEGSITLPEDLSQISLKVIMVNRWILPQERELKSDV